MGRDIPVYSLSRSGAGGAKKCIVFRTQCYRTTDAIDDSGAHLRLYFLQYDYDTMLLTFTTL